MKTLKTKIGAMEMSVGTMVTIVLLMVVLVLGIFLVQKIFRSGTNAVDSIDAEVQSQIQKLFAEEGRELAVYPTSRRISLKQGESDKGFAFSIRNTGRSASTFEYKIEATDVRDCLNIDKEEATRWVLGGTGGIQNLAPGATLEARLVTFIIPDNAPLCTLEYTLEVKRDGQVTSAPNIFVTIK